MIEVDENQTIEYRYLNMDKGAFCDSNEELLAQLGTGARIVSIPNWHRSQVLIAAGFRPFRETDALRVCRTLSGVDPRTGGGL